MNNSKNIFEKSIKNRRGMIFPKTDNLTNLNHELLRKTQCDLPELSELDVVRHFTNLANLNFSLDANFYPLGSCTMKYNPKITEKIAAYDSFNNTHPFLSYLPEASKYMQANLAVVYYLEKYLSEIVGMPFVTSHPMAGSHGEFLGTLIIKEYHKAKGNKKNTILIPDSAHGTNPASAAMAGFEVVSVQSKPNGEVDLEALKTKVNDDIAGIMLTCPNTLGIFETNIKKIAEIMHNHDALMYYDGANLNAILGKVKPGDLGFDIVHINLHKTFATPHGCGGPGAGPIGVAEKLAEFLPYPRVIKKNSKFEVSFKYDDSLKVTPFWGNFLVLVKALVYILILGKEGLISASENAVLNANYILAKLKPYFEIQYENKIMHEAVFSADKQAKNGVRALDIAKALIDQGIHPPTIYFPLIVKECLMIEPTETESKETLDEFIEKMIEIVELAEKNPAVFQEFPKTTSVGRLDETKAARELKVCL